MRARMNPTTMLAAAITLAFSASVHADDAPLPPPADSVATAPAPSHPLAANEMLSSDELHKLVDAGQYKDALRGLARPLQLRGPAAGAYDRHDLLMLKAECLIQSHDNATALATLALAHKESAAAAKPEEVLLADALAELIQKSTGGVYLPKTGASRLPIKLLDRSARKSAYDALFADQFTLFQQKAAAASNAKSLPPFLEAAKSAAAVRAVEFASTGSNTQSSDVMKDLADHALKLLTDVLDDLDVKQTRISTAANRQITETYYANARGQSYPQNRTHKAGLGPNDPAALKEIIETCKKMPPAAQQLADAFGTEQDAFKAVATKADDLKAKATITLTTDYTGYTNGN
jgi:hypothetical protein